MRVRNYGVMTEMQILDLPFAERGAARRQQVARLFADRPEWTSEEIKWRLGMSSIGTAASACTILSGMGLVDRVDNGTGCTAWAKVGSIQWEAHKPPLRKLTAQPPH